MLHQTGTGWTAGNCPHPSRMLTLLSYLLLVFCLEVLLKTLPKIRPHITTLAISSKTVQQLLWIVLLCTSIYPPPSLPPPSPTSPLHSPRPPNHLPTVSSLLPFLKRGSMEGSKEERCLYLTQVVPSILKGNDKKTRKLPMILLSPPHPQGGVSPPIRGVQMLLLQWLPSSPLSLPKTTTNE